MVWANCVRRSLPQPILQWLYSNQSPRELLLESADRRRGP